MAVVRGRLGRLPDAARGGANGDIRPIRWATVHGDTNTAANANTNTNSAANCHGHAAADSYYPTNEHASAYAYRYAHAHTAADKHAHAGANPYCYARAGNLAGRLSRGQPLYRVAMPVHLRLSGGKAGPRRGAAL